LPRNWKPGLSGYPWPLRLARATHTATPAFVDLYRTTAETERLADDLKIMESQPAQQFAEQPWD
jgi:hypothetical protein